MADYSGLKRRAVEDDNEDDITEPNTDEESVTPNSDTRKRPRLSLPELEDDDDDDDDEPMGSIISDDEGMNNTQDEPVTRTNDEQPDTSYASLNDQEAIDRVLAEEAEEGQTDRLTAENAIIEEVHCENFMCHANLTIKIGPLINFIVGHNGSGKSAVLTALTICLGGKASATNRGSNLKAFIKEGRTKCTLSVKVKNQGLSAYKPDLYGPSIIVQRYFTRNNTSGFNLKSATGKTISTKREDLDDMLDYFMLQLDNPMNVLTQDMARQFLNSSSPSEKYKFFQKGTQLERLDADYRATTAFVEKMEVSHTYLAESVTEARTQYHQAKKNSEIIKSMEKTEQKISLVCAQQCWAQVEELEQQLIDQKKDLEEKDVSIAKLQKASEDAGQQYTDENERVERLTQRKAEITTELSPLEDKAHELSESLQHNKKEMQELQIEEREIHSEIKSDEKQVTEFARLMDEEKARLENQSGGRSNQIASMLVSIETTINDRKQKQAEYQDEKRDLIEKSEQLKEVQRQCNVARETKYNQVEARKRQIQDLEKGGDNMSHEVRQILNDITKETRFREKPVGPMWKHIFLNDQKWSSILEISLNAALDGYCVTSKHDQDLLAQIFRKNRLQKQPKIFIGERRHINVEEPSPDLQTSLRVLKIDDELVRNALIINQAIDQTVLIQHRPEAIDINLRQLPKVRQIFCYHDDQTNHRNHGHRLAISANGDASISPVKPWVGRTRMQADAKAQIAHERANLAAEASDLKVAEQALQTANNNVDECRRDSTRLERKLKELIPEIQKLDHDKANLEDEQASLDGRSTLPSLETEYKKVKDLLVEHQATLQIATREKIKLGKTSKDLFDQRKGVEANIAIIKKKIDDAEDDIRSARDKRDHILVQKNTFISNIGIAIGEKETLAEDIAAQEEHIQEFIESASTATENFIKQRIRVNVPAGETYDTLELSRKSLQGELTRAQALVGGTPEQLKLKELAAKNNHLELTAKYEDSEALIKKLRQSLENRVKRWKNFREHIAIRASAAFAIHLSAREFRGKLLIDHQKKELSLLVEPDVTKRTGKGRGTTTLSGGEKSFSQIAMLLAFWDAMGSPIRCLDEFDVFMDSVNRTISMDIMIKSARNASTKQFIFITPQAMSNVRSARDVNVKVLQQPLRNQSTIVTG